MIMSIIALFCLAFIALIFSAIDPETQPGAGMAKATLMIFVAVPAGVIVGGLL